MSALTVTFAIWSHIMLAIIFTPPLAPLNDIGRMFFAISLFGAVMFWVELFA